ncbi:MAG: tyrosine recombinase XerC [Gammaproteobacteria bacterium]|uniref:tyrosine recombinase XerC n=1 Tax=uncultured Pseudacidovorax sp. TaxID=679313 RepID=UPI0025CE3FE5|nr:tyrosine recombinase XerC [uncultured Pseudacidovorax sp.]
MRAGRSSNQSGVADTRSTNEDYVAAFLDFLRAERGLSNVTLDCYRQQLAVLVSRAEKAGLSLALIETPMIDRWAKQDVLAGSAPRTVALRLTVWRGLFRWMLARHIVDANPALPVIRPKTPRRLPKALSVEQACTLSDFRRDGATPWLEARDVAIVELLYGCGLRVGELTGLDLRASKASLGWIDFDAGVVIVRGKGSAWRSVPVHELVERAVKAWMKLRPDFRQEQDAMFVTLSGARMGRAAVRSMVNTRAQRASVGVPVHPHMLRHTFASHLLQSCEDLRSVQALLGHELLGSTQVYTHLDFAHLTRVYESSHPLAGGPREAGNERALPGMPGQLTSANAEPQAPH